MLGHSPLSQYPISDKLTYTVPAETLYYSFGTAASAPTTGEAASTALSSTNYTDIATVNSVFVDDSSGSAVRYFVFQRTHANNTDSIAMSWTGKSTIAASTTTISLQVYNYTTPGWTTIATDTTTAANTALTLSGTQSTSLSSYYGGPENVITARVVQ